jgi:DNA-binding transcriptional LysR family regulator
MQNAFMLDVRRLLVLRELARTGTVAKAADALHLTPSAVSQQLAALGRETGVVLLEPDGRRVRLTAAAHVLLEHAEAVFAELQRAESSLAAHRAGERGEVRVAAFSSAISGLVVPAMRRLAATHPDLAVAVRDLPHQEATDALLHGEVDLQIAIVTGGGDLGQDRTTVRALLADVLDVALPQDSPLAAADAVALTTLADEPFVAGADASACYQITLAACASAGFVPRTRHRTDDWHSILAIVAAGAGVALVPRVAQPLTTPGVVIRPIAGEPPRRHLVTVVRRGCEDAPHLRTVLAALEQVAAGVDPDALRLPASA